MCIVQVYENNKLIKQVNTLLKKAV